MVSKYYLFEIEGYRVLMTRKWNQNILTELHIIMQTYFTFAM